MRTVMIAAVLAAFPLVARADPPAAEFTERSPDRAFAWSTLPFLGGIGLFGSGLAASSSNAPRAVWAPMTFVGLAGIIAGPTLGHAYAGKTWSNWLGLRLTGFAAMVIGGALLVDRERYNDSGSTCTNCKVPAYFALGGAGLFVVTTVGEIVTASTAAEDYNREHHLDVHLAAIQGTNMPGLAVSGAF